jgi:hypothetical protein
VGRREHSDGGVDRVLNFEGREICPARVHLVSTEDAVRLHETGNETPPVYEAGPI